ncbi:receptor-like protein 6 [Spinacia oleracea]|uniref:Receptor-like protein 6 n=1 Tax=Spinacia oleracea TaxID=3562 RepID=A0A9R0I5U7_SPIOL|nr:receptor-like protein 6 [Spinacia oleracea]
MGFLTWIDILFLVLVCSHATKQIIFVSSFRPSCADHERMALVQFRRSFLTNCAISDTPSEYPRVKSWSSEKNEDCCLWDGVECEVETGYVTGLDLGGSCLYGNFPPNSTLFSLTHLKKLSLAFNDFNYSHIPSKIGEINKLQSLNLSYSSFSGQIPSEISKLSELRVLDLSNNGDSLANSQRGLKLHDPSLEKLLRNLTHISQLYLDMVDLSSTVPITLTKLSSLKAISLQNCNLYGELPTSLFRLPQLEILHLSGNKDLAGFLPEFHSNSPLKELHLYGTSFSGKVPQSIGNLAHLEQLDLCGCYFSGSLPSSLANMTTLTVLLLSNNNFKGEVSFSITNLTNLESLDFSNLEIRPRELFSQLSKLNNIIYLRLAEMKLATEIPSFIANFTKLTYLDLAGSQIMGPFPKWFANLTQLRQLYLENNQLEGPIPHWFSQFTNLQSLDLSYNNLFGKFDTFFQLKDLRNLVLSHVNLTFPNSGTNSSLPKLKLLELAYCNLTEFPQFLQYQNELQSLSLRGNNIKGILPQWLVNITKESLLIINLSGNKLTGFEQATVVLPWTHLEEFHFAGNKLHGLLPSPPDSMKFYDVSNNKLTGVMPKQICNARSLISLDLSGNNLTGQIPDCIGNQLGESLQLLNLRGNNLHGTISTKFTTSCKLRMINLSQNQLGGELPRSFANCTMLEVLDVGRNQINDSFPSWLGSLPKLQVLILGHNKFYGRVLYQKSDLSFRFLRIIDLSHNLHTGGLPSRYFQNWHAMKVSKEEQSGSYNTLITFYFKLGVDYVISQQNFEYSITITNKGSEILYPKILKVFRVIDLSSNNFTGRIPDDIGDLKGLQALNLSNNNLEGRIPPSLSNITDLESLDLSLNKLSGEIPPSLSQLTTLEVFNISYNDHLMGPIPQGNQFNTFDDTSFQGNPGLCGSLISQKCGNADIIQLSPPSVNSDKSDDEDSELIDWIIKSLGCISGTIVGFVIGKIYITDKYHEWFMETFGRRRT